MNIEEIETKLNQIEEIIPKMKDIISDIKICNTETSKNILITVLKKYSQTITEFNI